MLRGAVAPAMCLLVSLGFALPASARPLSHIGYRHLTSPATVVADCNVYYRNVCFLRMNECLLRLSFRPVAQSEVRACESAFFACIYRFKCERGPVW